MIKKLLIAVGAAAVAAVGGSLIRPFGAPDSSAKQVIFRAAQIDPETLAIVQRACQNCHSQNTEWPWYSHVAPVSWLVVSDVNEGRRHMNLSDWPKDSERAAKKLERMSEEVGYKVMPPAKYTLLHPAARLTDSQREQLIHWADQEAERLKPAGAGK